MSRILNAKRAKYPYRNDLDCVAQAVGARVKVDARADPLTVFFNDRAASLGTQVATLVPSGFFGGEGPRTGACQAAHCDHWVLDAGPEPVGRMVHRVGHLDHCRPKRLAHFWTHENNACVFLLSVGLQDEISGFHDHHMKLAGGSLRIQGGRVG